MEDEIYSITHAYWVEAAQTAFSFKQIASAVQLKNGSWSLLYLHFSCKWNTSYQQWNYPIPSIKAFSVENKMKTRYLIFFVLENVMIVTQNLEFLLSVISNPLTLFKMGEGEHKSIFCWKHDENSLFNIFCVRKCNDYGSKSFLLSVITNPLTLFRMGEGEVAKSPTTSFSPVTSTNVELSTKNLTFSFNPFATLV